VTGRGCPCFGFWAETELAGLLCARAGPAHVHCRRLYSYDESQMLFGVDALGEPEEQRDQKRTIFVLVSAMHRAHIAGGPTAASLSAKRL
jgi:hypothetical protein